MCYSLSSTGFIPGFFILWGGLYIGNILSPTGGGFHPVISLTGIAKGVPFVEIARRLVGRVKARGSPDDLICLPCQYQHPLVVSPLPPPIGYVVTILDVVDIPRHKIMKRSRPRIDLLQVLVNLLGLCGSSPGWIIGYNFRIGGVHGVRERTREVGVESKGRVRLIVPTFHVYFPSLTSQHHPQVDVRPLYQWGVVILVVRIFCRNRSIY